MTDEIAKREYLQKHWYIRLTPLNDMMKVLLQNASSIRKSNMKTGGYVKKLKKIDARKRQTDETYESFCCAKR